MKAANSKAYALSHKRPVYHDGSHFSSINRFDNITSIDSNKFSASGSDGSHEDRFYSCPGCSFSSCSLSIFQSHLKIHWGEKLRYLCNEKGCSKHFTTHGHLLEHIRAHTGERPFSCSVCDKRFMRINTLNVHFKKHTKAKPFICPIETCKAQYTEKGNLTKHMKAKHQQNQLKSQNHEVRIHGSDFKFSTASTRIVNSKSETEGSTDIENSTTVHRETSTRSLESLMNQFCLCEEQQSIHLLPPYLLPIPPLTVPPHYLPQYQTLTPW